MVISCHVDSNTVSKTQYTDCIESMCNQAYEELDVLLEHWRIKQGHSSPSVF